MDGSGTNRGERRAPVALREAGLAKSLGGVDFGDLPVTVDDSDRDPSTGIVGYRQVATNTALIADAVASAMFAGWRPLVLGGCCSILPGALTGVRRHSGPTKLVFVDGHLDLFTPADTRTGELAGMALAVATGYLSRDVRALSGDLPLVEPGDVLALGDADGSRRQLAGAAEASAAIPDARVFDAMAIRAVGVEVVADRTAALIDQENMPFWLHLDVDVLDGTVMPAVSFPVGGGLDWGELEVLLRPIGRDHRLAGVSLAGLNVDRDPGREHTAQVAGLLTSLLA